MTADVSNARFADLSVRTFGDPAALPLVLLHPIATNGDAWALQSPVLARSRYVIVPDLAGHGRSPGLAPGAALADHAAAVLRAVDALDVGPFGLVGLSFGGMVAQALALAAPERVRTLVLAHCGARSAPVVRTLWAERVAAARAHGMAAQVDATLARWFTPPFRAEARATCDWVGRMVGATSVEGYAAAADAICGLDHLDRLGALRCPTLVIAGRRDAAIPVEAAEAVTAAIAGARLLVLEDAAHLGQIEQPQRFTEALDAFIDR